MTSRDITLIGVPLEEGSGRRRCAMGPAAFRIAGIAGALEGLGFQVTDSGDLTASLFGRRGLDRPIRSA